MPKKRTQTIWNRLTGRPIGSEKRNPFTEKPIKRIPKKRRRTRKWKLQNRGLEEEDLLKRNSKCKIGGDEMSRNVSTMRTRSKKANFRKKRRPHSKRQSGRVRF